MVLILLLAAIVGGACFTYLFSDDEPLSARLWMGTAIGVASLGLAGFLAASILGLDTAALAVAGGVVLWPLPVLAWPTAWRRRFRPGLGQAIRRLRARRLRGSALALALCSALALVLLWRVYDRAMFVTAEGIHTGVDHNLGDLPFHIGIVMGFAAGDNFPPEHPELAGTRLTYPFLVDMVSAVLVRAGASLRDALFWPGLLLAAALVGLVHRWARLTTRDGLAAGLAPVLVLFSGGLGWLMLPRDAAAAQSWGELLWHLPHDYTIGSGNGLRWGNAVTTLLVPQRSLLLGLPLTLVIWSWWWRAMASDLDDRLRLRLMIGAGTAAGLLPLSHAHSFAVVLAMGACLALLFPRPRAWAGFFAGALVLAVPQLAWSVRGTALRPGSFLAWHLGWDRDGQNVVWFWLVNTGLFIPLLLAALVAHRRLLPRPLARFYLPFTLCFLVPNVLRLSPWIWDNIKFLFYWYVASAPLVALVVARLFRAPAAARVAAPLLLVALVASGALDVWRMVSGALDHLVFDADAVAFGRAIAETTPPHAVIAALPTHDSPVLLSGRRTLLGYVGHIWSQGLDPGTREQDLPRFYTGAMAAVELRDRYGVEYAVVGPRERGVAPGGDAAWLALPMVAEQGPYELRRLPRREGPGEEE